MLRHSVVILVLFVSCISPSAASGYELRLLSSETVKATGAYCLDGSAPGYYLRRGTEATKFKIHMQGGGWCVNNDDCLGRSKSILGSSVDWARPGPGGPNQTKDWDIGISGLLGNDTTNHFSNWTTVFFRYCDGSSYSSHRAEPVVYKGATLYYRGKNILEAVYADILEYAGMNKATEIILSGTSAGGLATYMHADHIGTLIPSTAKFVAIPDAGFFLDGKTLSGEYLFRERIISGIATWNDERAQGSNEACLAANTKEPWKCFFAQYLVPFINVPLFVVNSLYDPVNLHGVLDLKCGGNLSSCSASDLKAAEDFRVEYQSVLIAQVKTKNHGYFLTACNQHEETCRQKDFEGITIQGTTMNNAVFDWYSNPRPLHLVDVNWPDDSSCWVGGYHGAC